MYAIYNVYYYCMLHTAVLADSISVQSRTRRDYVDDIHGDDVILMSYDIILYQVQSFVVFHLLLRLLYFRDTKCQYYTTPK